MLIESTDPPSERRHLSCPWAQEQFIFPFKGNNKTNPSSLCGLLRIDHDGCVTNLSLVKYSFHKIIFGTYNDAKLNVIFSTWVSLQGLLETRARIHGTLQNTPKASSLMLTPGWR